MTYDLEFHPLALKEWKNLAPNIKQQFKKKLEQRLLNPCIPASQLSGHMDTYKIKLRSVGYRLIYSVNDDIVVVYVLAVGKRENNKVYDSLLTRKP
ncbi:type II toxin-antitoxin system RelE family toxin [Psychrobacter sp. 72-O-c]|uniref:type II toxin-antitoxin system RelE family toxin n=1 Tax=Psychrobacter sp. 72-O-c TaxID=2774125 RepID=UPI00191A8103|nr:type II toxin-antitoxin system RelE/ParE family toxin [Psychrobacter sp. 72-O-c]